MKLNPTSLRNHAARHFNEKPRPASKGARCWATLFPDGLARTHWSNAGPIRTIFREAFLRAGIPYANPHSFRATLAGLGEKLCRSPEEFKAWSQNMGHEGVLTTFTSYGEVGRERQAQIIRSLADPAVPGSNVPGVEKVLEAALAISRHSRDQI
jgi:integrase/recombinase XerD